MKNKSLVALLLIMQIVFIAFISFLTITYQLKIVENAKAISDYISEQQISDNAVMQNIMQQKSIFGDDPLLISRNFNEMLKNFRIYMLYIFASLVLFGSISWALTAKIMHKLNFGRLRDIFLRNLAVLSIYLGLMFLIFLSLFNLSLTQIATEGSRLAAKYLFFITVSIILSYFMFISLSLTCRTELKNIFKRTFFIGVKKISYIFITYFINIASFIIGVFLLYNFIDKNVIVLSVSVMIILFSFVFSRILMVDAFGKLSDS